MRILAVNSLFGSSNILSKTKVVKNVGFTGEEGDRSRLALEIYEIREELGRDQNEYNSIQEIAQKGLPYDVERAAKLKLDIIDNSKKFKELDKKYRYYNPKLYDFMKDVEKGRTLRLIELENTDDGSATLNDVMGTSAGDWPFYSP